MGAGALGAGTPLTIPGGVVGSRHNADTFKPYDPAEAIGNTSPNTPQPPKKNNCGIVGQILVAVVAIAVTAWLGPKAIALATKVLAGPAATAAAASAGTAIGGSAAFGGAVIGGAVAGAAGSAVSQGVGIATGIQERFNWGAVGMAAIAGGIAGGLNVGDGGSPMIRGIKSEFLSNFVNGAAQAAIGGVLSQGLGVVTGLQKKFDWAGVAAGVIGGGLSAGVGGGRFVAPTVDGVASAAARSLITGTSFGDNIVAVLPSVIGRTIGSLVADGLSGDPYHTGSIRAQRGGIQVAQAGNDDQSVLEILVTATQEQVKAAKKGFFDWVDSWAGTNLSGNNPREKREQSARDRAYEASLVFRANSGPKYASDEPGAYLFAPDHPITGRFTVQSRVELYRAGDKISGFLNGTFGKGSTFDSLATPLGDGLGTVLRYTVGPGTPVDTLINKPFYGTLDLISQTPLSDPGVIMTLESNGVTAPLGGLSAGIKGVVDLRRATMAAETAVPQVTANRLAGNAFRDEIAAALRAEGRGVQTEVYKKTPFGARYMDIEVSDLPGGTVLGGIETKLGNSRYTPSQRAKDMFLKIWEKYPVNVVREPR